MEYQASSGGTLSLGQFASVVLQDAAANVPSPRLSRSLAHEDQLILGVDGFPSFSRGQNFEITASSPGLLGLSTPGHDEYTDDPRFLESQREFRDLLLTSAQSLAPTRASSPINLYTTSSISPGAARDSSIIKRIISTGERVAWLRKYLDEVAPWLDMFDEQQHFKTKVPLLAESSLPLVYAILAISARQIEREKRLQGDRDSLQLYQESIRSLTPQLLTRDPNIMATCVILCVMEMMSASPSNWRRHLDGCAALLSSHSINGLSGGLLQAVFWCYARMDLCAAIISAGEESVVLPLENWLPPGERTENATLLFYSSRSPDMWANYAVYLTARVCHLIWIQSNELLQTPSSPKKEPFAHSWHILWEEVQDWCRNRPPELFPLKFAAELGDFQNTPFPFILFAAPCAISSNQLYHTACLLLLDICPSSINPTQLGQIGSKLWHARRICGISSTNEHHGCLNNAIQPLWIAGKLLSHPVEHKALVDLICAIEAKTGWAGKWRIPDLKEVWGYDRDAQL